MRLETKRWFLLSIGGINFPIWIALFGEQLVYLFFRIFEFHVIEWIELSFEGLLSNANINILKEEELFVSSDRELVTDCNAIHSIIYFCI